MPSHNKAHFAPQLFIPSGVTNISFYTKAFGAVEVNRWCDDDGSIHVAEFSIGEAIFHLHEEKNSAGHLTVQQAKGITALIGLFVDDVDLVTSTAVAAGGILISPPTTYDYQYRQAQVQDPFGHIWLIEKKLK